MLATQPCTLAPTTGYRVYRPATQPCTVALITVYRMYRPGTGYTTLVPLTRPPNWLQSHPTQSIQLCVDSGAGRQQVPTNMASTDWLQSLQITRPVYRLYSLSFTKTGCRVTTSTIGYRACRQGTGYTTLLHRNRLQSLPN